MIESVPLTAGIAWHISWCISGKMNAMSDNKNKTDFRDRDRISMNETYEVSYWSERFGISKEDLARAVVEVGNMVANVEEWVKESKTPVGKRHK